MINNQKYKVSIKVNDKVLPFLKNGDSVKVKYLKEKEVIDIISVE